MPGGIVFGTLFFTMLAFAAVTSSISLLEPAVSYFEEQKGIGRWTAALFGGGAAFAVGLLSVFSFNELKDVLPLAFLGITEVGSSPATFYPIIDFTVSNIVMPVGGLGVAVFAGWIASKAIMREELDLPEGGIFAIWHALVKYLCPPALIIVIMGGVGDVRGVIIASLILGLAETAVASLIDPGLTLAAAYFMFILVLLFRPQGLFGKPAS